MEKGGDEEQGQNHNHTTTTIEEKLSFKRAYIFIFFLTISIIPLILWLVYCPTRNPEFTLVDISVVSGLNKSTATMQFTMVARNPNKQVAIYYDNLTASVLYRNEEMMAQVMLPPLFQKKKSTTTVSSGAMPMAFDVEKEIEGSRVWLSIELLGRVRWKIEMARPINIGYYELSVKCEVFVDFKRGLEAPLTLLSSPPCIVDID